MVDEIVRIVLAELALEHPALNGQTLDIAGPDNKTNMDVVRLYERLAGRPAKVSHAPLGMLRVMYRVLRPFHPGLSQIMQFSACNDTFDTAVDAAPLMAKYPIEFARLEEWAGQRVQSETVALAVA